MAFERNHDGTVNISWIERAKERTLRCKYRKKFETLENSSDVSEQEDLISRFRCIKHERTHSNGNAKVQKMLDDINMAHL